MFQLTPLTLFIGQCKRTIALTKTVQEEMNEQPPLLLKYNIYNNVGNDCSPVCLHVCMFFCPTSFIPLVLYFGSLLWWWEFRSVQLLLLASQGPELSGASCCQSTELLSRACSEVIGRYTRDPGSTTKKRSVGKEEERHGWRECDVVARDIMSTYTETHVHNLQTFMISKSWTVHVCGRRSGKHPWQEDSAPAFVDASHACESHVEYLAIIFHLNPSNNHSVNNKLYLPTCFWTMGENWSTQKNQWTSRQWVTTCYPIVYLLAVKQRFPNWGPAPPWVVKDLARAIRASQINVILIFTDSAHTLSWTSLTAVMLEHGVPEAP